MATKRMRASGTKIRGPLAAPDKSIELYKRGGQESLDNSAPDLISIASESLTQFWKSFHLSPIDLEHTLLTNIGWLTLIALGPLCLWALLGGIHDMIFYRQGSFLQYFFSYLKDPIFSTITLSLFFGVLLFRFRWYPTIRTAFQSLLQNEVLCNQTGGKLTASDFLKFMKDYLRNLHSQKRYILVVIFTLFILGVSFFTTTSRGYWHLGQLNETTALIFFLHVLSRWILAPIVWSYVGMLWMWCLATTTKVIIDLTPCFQINVRPLHSDRAGGLKKLGDLCSYVGLLIIVIVIPLAVLSVERTIMSMSIRSCGSEMQQFATGQIDMTQERLTECIYYASAKFENISLTQLSDYVTDQLSGGVSLQQLAIESYNHSQKSFQRTVIFANYSFYYVMDFFLLLTIFFAFYVFIVPLIDIHKSMTEFKHKLEFETNEHISRLLDEMTTLIKRQDLKAAEEVKSDVNFLANELNEIQKYPSWPISSFHVARRYLTSSLLTALATYVLSLLQLSLSAEASGVINEAIGSIFGH